MWMVAPAVSFISEGTRVQGSVSLHSSASIHGVVEGDVVQQSVEQLQVGHSGWVHGSITSLGPILIEGRVEGDIRCRSRVRISASAVVRGSLEAPAIDVAPGAQVNGDLKISRRDPSTLAERVDSAA